MRMSSRSISEAGICGRSFEKTIRIDVPDEWSVNVKTAHILIVSPQTVPIGIDIAVYAMTH